MSFKAIYQHTRRHEGGYSNNPADRGGETFRGISRVSWPHWIGWLAVDEIKAAGKTSAEEINAHFKDDDDMATDVAALYFTHFWVPAERLLAPPRVTGKLFDAGVNIGLGRAVKFAQATMNDMGARLTVDGAIGPKTRAAAAEIFQGPEAETEFLERFIMKQLAHYQRLAEQPGQAQFLDGWITRALWLPEAV